MRKEDAHRKHTGMDDCAHPSGCQGDMRNDGTIESIWVEMTAHIREIGRGYVQQGYYLSVKDNEGDGGVAEGEPYCVFDGTVEGGFPPVVENDIVGRVLKTLRSYPETVVGRENRDSPSLSAVDFGAVRDGEYGGVVGDHLYPEPHGIEVALPRIFHQEGHVTYGVVFPLAGGGKEKDVGDVTEVVGHVIEGLGLVIGLLFGITDCQMAVFSLVRSGKGVHVPDDCIGKPSVSAVPDMFHVSSECSVTAYDIVCL